VRQSAPHMNRLSPERVKQELEKTMEQVRRPSSALALWKTTGVLGTVIPALADVSDHTLLALDCLARPTNAAKSDRLFVRVALPFVELGEERARSTLTALRFSRAEIRRVAALAVAWRELGVAIAGALRRDELPPDVDVRKWVSVIGRLDIAPFMRIAGALCAAEKVSGENRARQLRRLYRRMREVARHDPIAIADLAVDGDDLRMTGIPAGPWLGMILQALLEAVLADPERNKRDWLLQEARRLYETTGRS
jgi:tRNA nucleotidyltransferase (CCA-adding enzyme)